MDQAQWTGLFAELILAPSLCLLAGDGMDGRHKPGNPTRAMGTKPIQLAGHYSTGDLQLAQPRCRGEETAGNMVQRPATTDVTRSSRALAAQRAAARVEQPPQPTVTIPETPPRPAAPLLEPTSTEKLNESRQRRHSQSRFPRPSNSKSAAATSQSSNGPPPTWASSSDPDLVDPNLQAGVDAQHMRDTVDQR